MCLTADAGTVAERWMKKNEVEEVGEEAQETIKQDSATNAARRTKFVTRFE